MSTTFVSQTNLEQASFVLRKALADGKAAMSRAAYGPTVENTPTRIADVLRGWAAGVRAARADGFANALTIAEVERQLSDAALQALKDLRTGFDAALEVYKAKLTAVRLPLSADEHAILWRRIERQLSAGWEIADLVEDADLATLQVLGDEIKSWRRAQMVGDKRTADYISAGDMERVNARRYELADPAQRRNIDLARGADKGAYRVGVAFGVAESTIAFKDDFITTPNEARQVTLPDWPEGKDLVFAL